jgi:uncharacterized membrane protein YedE/YeeE
MMDAGTPYWPWWLGALCLGGVSLLHLVLTGKVLGVSGAWQKVVSWRAQAAIHEAEQAFADGAAFEAELERATRAEFGAAHHAGDGLDNAATVPATPGAAPVMASPVAGLLLLVMMAVGGGLSAALAGRWSLQWEVGGEFARLVASGPSQGAVLLLGGVLVGFGTRMAGGCTSGHGLAGCARLQPASLVATAGFFGAGVALSLLLGG